MLLRATENAVRAACGPRAANCPPLV